MQIGSGCTRRDIRDGQSLASPGRWPVEQRTCPDDETWRFVAGLYTDLSRRVGTPALLKSLALGKISKCPFSLDSIQTLKHWDPSPEGSAWHPAPDCQDSQHWEVEIGRSRGPRKTTERGNSGGPVLEENYSSLPALSDKVKDVPDGQSRRGHVLKLTEYEARKLYPDLVVAALGANRKDKPTGVVSARGQIEVGGDVYVNKVGTFGVASASYYWSRAASVVGRLTQHFTGRSANTWRQFVADDIDLEESGTEYRAAMLSFFVLCSTAAVLLSWGKTAGGDKVTWVGSRSSTARTTWESRNGVRAEEVSSSDTVNTTKLPGRTGPLDVRRRALEHERPFLSPLCSFLAVHSRGVGGKCWLT